MEGTAGSGERASFAELPREHRLATGLTQEALAECAGLSVRGIQAWERGETRPHRESVARPAGALGLTGDARAAFEDLAPPAPRRPALVPGIAGSGRAPTDATLFVQTDRSAGVPSVTPRLAGTR